MTELKCIWPVILTGECPKIISSPVVCTWFQGFNPELLEFENPSELDIIRVQDVQKIFLKGLSLFRIRKAVQFWLWQ